MEKYERLTEELIITIGSLLTSCGSATELASQIHFDVSGLIKHIKKYRSLFETAAVNKCGRKMACPHRGDLCPSCYRKGKGLSECACSSCKKNCNQICVGFTKLPSCPKLDKFPYVCNGCEKLGKCRLNHYFYEPTAVWKAVSAARSDPRKGNRIGADGLAKLSGLLTPLIKEKRQSLPQIFLSHKEEIGCSYVTLLKYIDLGMIPGIKNIDLTKRVRYPKKYAKNKAEPTNAASLSGRGGRKCLLTFLFRKSNYMMAFLLESKESAEVAKVFASLRGRLGKELFSKAFACILTDNGSEFCDPASIEFDPATGERLCHLFYCDPGKSGQKGKIEKNHVELRKVFPKGTVFDRFTQKQVDIALSHINSEPRAILNANCPGKIATVWLNEKVLALNEYESIEPDEVFLSPELLK